MVDQMKKVGLGHIFKQEAILFKNHRFICKKYNKLTDYKLEKLFKASE